MKRDIIDWFGRIHIGRWNDRHVWGKAVERVAIKWLHDTPRIENATENVMAWQKAGLLLGVGTDKAKCVCENLKEELRHVKNDRVNPEHLLLAYALKDNPENVNAFVETYKNSTIPYRKHENAIRYVDTIGMVVPYLHWIGMDVLAKRQMEEYDKAMWKNVFPAHAYNMDLDLPMGVFDWCRGCGWYILALVESVDMDGLKERVLNLAPALLPLQKGNGGFGAFFFNKDTRQESSGTALIGLLMLTAYDFTNEDKYLTCAKNCERALMEATRRDGSVDFCQGDTACIGDYSHVFSLMPFAQGMALKLYKMLNKYD